MATTITVKATIEDIQDLAHISLFSLFDGQRRAAEAEAMVAQTLRASITNHKCHGVAFSWRGDDIRRRSDNATAYDMLLNRKYFIEEQREGKTVIIVTQKLIDLLRGHLAKRRYNENYRER